MEPGTALDWHHLQTVRSTRCTDLTMCPSIAQVGTASAACRAKGHEQPTQQYRMTLTLVLAPPETATGRSQPNFPLSAPLPAPTGQRVNRGHGAHASISGPIASSPTNNFQSTPLSSFGAPGARGPPPAGANRRMNMPSIPPFAAQPSIPEVPPPQQHQTPPPPQGISTPPPPPPPQGQAVPQAQPRAGRRQYAANTAAYIAGEAATAPTTSGHAHSQSQQYFSPNAPVDQQQPGTFFSPSDGVPQGFQQQPGAQPAPSPYQQGPPAAFGGALNVGGLTNQFGQMGVSGQRQAQMVSTTNLIGLPLNPAELMTMEPPEIRLPPNVRSTKDQWKEETNKS